MVSAHQLTAIATADIETVGIFVGHLFGSDSFLVTIVHRMRYARSIHLDASVVQWLRHWAYNRSMLCLFQSALKELHELCLTSEIKVYAVSVSVYFKTFTRGRE